jgi:hypothetical protein
MMFAASCGLVAAGLLAGCSQERSALTPEQVAEHNRAVALMGQYKYAEAETILGELAGARPEDPGLQIDWSIALLNRQNDGDVRKALAINKAVLRNHPDETRAAYVAGLLELYLGHPDKARTLLERAAATASSDAYVFYFLGQARQQAGDFPAALDAFLKAARLRPELASAWYGAAMVARQLGKKDKAAEWLQRYRRVQKSPRGLLAEFKYTRMGPLAMVVPRASRESSGDRGDSPTPATLVESFRPISDDTWNSAADHAAMWRSGSSGWLASVGDDVLAIASLSRAHTGAEFRAPLPGTNALGWTDLDNSGEPQLVTCGRGGLSVWRRDGEIWRGRPLSDGIASCERFLTVDWDHDGDLDVLLVRQGRLDWLVNLDDGASFEMRNLAANAADVVAFSTVDWDLDRDVDLIWTDGNDKVHWLENRLLEPPQDHILMTEPGAAFMSVLVRDRDSDGRWELLLLDRQGRLTQWSSGQPQSFDLARGNGRDLLPVFWGLDGRSVFALVTDKEVALIADAPDGRGLRTLKTLPRRQAVVLPDVTEHGVAALTILSRKTTGTAREQWAPQADGGHWLALTLSGAMDDQALRSNRAALGTLVRVRAGRAWASFWAQRHGSTSQHVLPHSVWLDSHPAADYIELRWPDGVYQTEIQVASGHQSVVETERQLSSCPVLFVKGDDGYQFVTDVLGVGGLGFMHAPGHYSEPRPWEFVRLPDTLTAQNAKVVEMHLAEPMEENTYLDSVRLHRWWLPEGWHLVMDERMGTALPEPTGQPVFYRKSWLPSRARANGREVLPTLLRADGQPVPLHGVSRRYLGSLDEPLRLELWFPELPKGGRFGLVTDAWVEYPYSQTLLAAYQAGRTYDPPSIEILVDGVWRPWRRTLGYPAGMPRESYFPLGQLPAGTTAVAIVTNLEVYWDRIRLIREETPPESVEHQVFAPTAAELQYLGYPVRTRQAWKRPEFDFAKRRTMSDMKNLEGLYTRFGDVRQLLGADDGAFVVYGSGESVHLAFATDGEGPPAGHHAVLAVEFRGYAKDMDLYTRDGGHVGPLPPPAKPGAEPDRLLHERFNQRTKGLWSSP